MPDSIDNTQTSDGNFSDILGSMSDEDFLEKADSIEEPTIENTDDSDDTENTTDTEDINEDDTDNEQTEEESSESEDETEEEETSEEDDDEIESDTEDTETDENTDSSEDSDENDIDSQDKEKDAKNEDSEANAAKLVAYDKIMSPFKANGIQMQMKSPEDVISLMQMGANYHKKMAGLKPSLKIVKLLEKNDLLDPNKINYLIDIHNKKPEAIQAMIKDSGIDIEDIDTDEESTYVPSSDTVSDSEYELDSVLDEIKNTKGYQTTIDIIANQWDDESRNRLASTPQAIKVLNAQVSDGIFDIVNNAVIYERSLGKLLDVPDIEAYRQMGNLLQEQGKLPGMPPNKPASPSPETKAKTKLKEQLRQKRKKAASPTKTKPVKTKKKPFDPLAVSDEEFEKLMNKSF